MFVFSNLVFFNFVSPLTVTDSEGNFHKSVANSPGLFSYEGIPYWILAVSLCSLVVSILAIYFSIRNNKTKDKSSDVKLHSISSDLHNVIQYCNKNSKTVSELKKRIAQLESQNSNQTQIPQEDKRVAHPRKSKKEAKPTTVPAYEEPKEYIWLKVIDGGKLTLAQGPDNAVYRAWYNNGMIFFEFSCLRTIKAINNRTSLIEPFCDIHLDSIHPDEAKEVLIKQCGKLSTDYSVISKVIIQYK